MPCRRWLKKELSVTFQVTLSVAGCPNQTPMVSQPMVPFRGYPPYLTLHIGKFRDELRVITFVQWRPFQSKQCSISMHSFFVIRNHFHLEQHMQQPTEQLRLKTGAWERGLSWIFLLFSTLGYYTHTGITLWVRSNEIHSSCTRAAFEGVGPLCVFVRVECTIVSRC